jgi:streptomycin 6-kinase
MVDKVYEAYTMKSFEKNIISLQGEMGKQWLADLRRLIAQMEKIYKLSALKPVENLSYNYVLSGFQGEQPIVLKLGIDNEALKREAAALKAFAGFGGVKVLAENEGILLLERAVSGSPLKSYFPKKDDEAVCITCKCLKRLHQASIPKAKVFSHIKDWLMVLNHNWPIPESYLQKARKLRDNLLQTSVKDVLLHGDLHHDNILQNGDGWLVIDPKGVIGEAAYEVAAFIRNPMPELLAQDAVNNCIRHRIYLFSNGLGIPQHRILEWCFVQAVLSWCWAIEDGVDVDYFSNLAIRLEAIVAN